jgi:hypothetical protein
MDSKSTQRIDAIRSKVSDERALISALQEKYSRAKDIFKSALNLLYDVKGIFLNPAILQEPRNAPGLTDILYQRDREIIAFARSDLAVSGTGSLSVAQAVGICVRI